MHYILEVLLQNIYKQIVKQGIYKSIVSSTMFESFSNAFVSDFSVASMLKLRLALNLNAVLLIHSHESIKFLGLNCECIEFNGS